MADTRLSLGDDLLVIETPERVPLHFALASIGNRFLACLFDHFLQFIMLLMIGAVVVWIMEKTDIEAVFSDAPKWAQAIIIIASFITWSCYFVIFEWKWNGQTPGKKLMKLRVIRDDGRPITFWESAVRNLMRIFDFLPPPFYSIGLISVFVSNRDQRIGDVLAGTVVIREREAEAPSFDRVFENAISDTALRRTYRPMPFTGDISMISVSEIEVVEAFLRRRFDLPDRAREWMAWRVASPILNKLRPEFDPKSFSYEAFLEELLHRYRQQFRFAA